MAFCTKCGKELNENDNFCPSCGEPAADKDTKTENNAHNNFAQSFNEFTDTEDRTNEFDSADISNNKVYAILAYISILVLVPLIAAPKSKFARFHTNQGFILFVGEAAYSVVRKVLLSVLSVVAWGPVWIVYRVVALATAVIGIVFPVFSVIGIIYVAQGKAKELPIIGKIKLFK